MVLWFLLNSVSWFPWHWDAYPFVFLNLFMSAEAAFTAPILLMSAAREHARDVAHLDRDTQLLEKLLEIEERQMALETRLIALMSAIEKDA